MTNLVEAAFLSRKALMQSSEPATLHDLFVRRPPEYLAPGRTLVMEGDDAEFVFEVLDGALRIFRSISDGRRVITGFMYPGDIVGISLGKRYLYSVETVCGSTVRRLSRTSLDAAVEDEKRVRQAIFSLVTDEMATAQDQMILLSSKTSDERLCSFLLQYLRRNVLSNDRHLRLDLPMCRQDIADYLGITVETVSRTFTRLTKTGILAFESSTVRHTMTVKNLPLLVETAGESEAGSEPLRSACGNEPITVPSIEKCKMFRARV